MFPLLIHLLMDIRAECILWLVWTANMSVQVLPLNAHLLDLSRYMPRSGIA